MVKRVLVGYGIDVDAVSGWYVFYGRISPNARFAILNCELG
jgi:hypothetical protein